MIKNYVYAKNSRINTLISQINTYKGLFEKIPTLPQTKDNLLRRSTLKSSLFSARIEGNELQINELTSGIYSNNAKREVFQIFRALKLVHSHKEPASREFICEIHSLIMDGLTTELGRFRSENSAIFNTAGVAIYLTPPPAELPGLVDEFIEYVNSSNLGLCEAAIAHFAFEKIHPFLDGNGRVGRALLSWHLGKLGYGFSGLISFEEYLEKNRGLYYSALSVEGKDITEFVELILTAISEGARDIILNLQEKKEENIEGTLLPRRAEILNIIREHKTITFDQIARRFLSVNPRTLHYDLQDLIKKKLIRKLGITRGAIYTAE